MSDRSLRELLPRFIRYPDLDLVNPASVDIRVGKEAIVETSLGWSRVPLDGKIEKCIKCPEDPCPMCSPFSLRPGQFALVSTFEFVTVPNGYAVDLRLKSSRARSGYDHSLAFWVDPGWKGVLTMEIRNVTQYQLLPLYCGMRMAQLIVHQLDRPVENPYVGKYNGADTVEAAKG